MSEIKKEVTLEELFAKNKKYQNNIIHSKDLEVDVTYKLSDFVIGDTIHGKKLKCLLNDEFVYYLPNRFNEFIANKELKLENQIMYVKVINFQPINEHQVPNFEVVDSSEYFVTFPGRL